MFSILGGLLVLVLFTALIGPYVVDWTRYRSPVESEATRLFGLPVRIDGRLDLSLLPTPSITAEKVRLGDDPGRPALTAERLTARMLLSPILSGELRFIELRLEQPVLHAERDGAGRLHLPRVALPPALRNPDRVVIEHIEIVDGRLEIRDRAAGTTRIVSGINLTGAAGSLVGPWRSSGGFVLDGHRYTLNLATGRPQESGLRIKLELLPADRPVAFTADTMVSIEDGGLHARGSADLRGLPVRAADTGAELGAGDAAPQAGSGNAPPAPGSAPWEVQSELELSPDRLLLRGLSMRLGPPESAYQLEGTASLTLGESPRFDAVISAQQIDLDRALGAGPDAPTDPASVARRLIEALARLPVPPIPGRLGFDTSGIVVAGELIQGLRFDAETTGGSGSWRISELEALLPGSTRLMVAGTLTTGAAPAFDGRVDVSSGLPAVFADWIGAEGSGLPAVLGALEIGGHLALSRGRVALEDISGRADGSPFSGAITFAPDDAGKWVLAARLDAGSLDLGLAGQVTRAIAPGLGARADAIRLDIAAQRAVLDGIEGQSLAADLSYDAGRLSVERLRIADLGGAEIEASGVLTGLEAAPEGQLSGRVRAKTAEGLVRLAEAFLDPDSATAIGRRIRFLGPLDLALDVSATKADTAASRVRIALKGALGGAALDATAGFEGSLEWPSAGRMTAKVGLSGLPGSAALAIAGFDAIPLDALGRASLELDVQGSLAEGLATEVVLGIGEARIEGSGRLVAAAEGIEIDGALSVAAKDAAPIFLALGRSVVAPGDALPLELKARLGGTTKALAIGAIEGRIGVARIDGELVLSTASKRPRLTGELAFDRLDLADIAALAVGPAAVAAPIDSDSPWPEAPFEAGPLAGIEVDLDIATARLDVLGQAGSDARFALRLRPQRAAVDDLTARLAGGRLEAGLGVNRSGDTLHLSGQVRLSGAALESLPWRSKTGAVIVGSADMTARFEAAGRSAAGVIASLAGDGSLTVHQGRARSMSPLAFSFVLEAGDSVTDLPAERIEALFRSHLDAGDLIFGDTAAAFTIGEGVIRARNIRLAAGAATVVGGGSIDLNRLSLEGEWTFSYDDPAKAETTAGVPQVRIAFSGPLEAPRRSIDVAPLVNTLTLRAFERQVRQIEMMQADILERQRFERELGRLDQERRRRAERARAAAEPQAPLGKGPDSTRPEQPAAQPDRTTPPAADASSAGADATGSALVRRVLEGLGLVPGRPPGNRTGGALTPGRPLAPIEKGQDIAPAPGSHAAPLSAPATGAPLDLLPPQIRPAAGPAARQAAGGQAGGAIP